MNHQDRIQESLSYTRRMTDASPGIGVILGSGLGGFVDGIAGTTEINTTDIPHYPQSTVTGHKGKLVFAAIGGQDVLAFQGRIHFYECNDLDVVLYPVRIAHALGIHTLIVTNAAGGINRAFAPGDLMIISDQMNLTLESHHDRSLSRARAHVPLYDPSLQEKAMDAGVALQVVLRKGVYAAVKGPSYETAAEIEMLGRLGADAVGMSTVFETQLAARLGMRVLGISCITNYATGISPSKLNHQEVTEVGNRVRTIFGNLLTSIITRL